MAHKSTNTFRFSDVSGEPLRRLPPIRGFENQPLVSLDEATEPLIGVVQEIEHMVYNIQQSDIQANNGLTVDESSSIALYSMEWSPREQSFYMILNETLRNPEREEFLPPWLKFLKLFFTALSKLPSTNHRIIYRGVKIDLRSRYKQGARIIWWGFSSCTKTLGVLEKEQFVGKNGTRTLFTIECETGKDIRQHSFFPKEDEILLLPGREFQVISSADMGNQLTMIQLKEVQPRFPNLASLPSSNPTLSTSTVNIASATTVTASSVQPKPSIQPVKVSYHCKGITSNDIPGVIKEALQQKQCTILNLSRNNITDEGAALLSKALKHNEVSDSLNISTIGERSNSISEYRSNFDLSFQSLIILSFLRLILLFNPRDVRCLKTNFIFYDEFEYKKFLIVKHLILKTDRTSNEKRKKSFLLNWCKSFSCQ